MKTFLLTTKNIIGIVLYYCIMIILLYLVYIILCELLLEQSVYYCEPTPTRRSGDNIVVEGDHVLGASEFYFNFRNKIRRRFVWHTFECDNIKYQSYNDFKNSWDPNFKIYPYVKSEINEDLHKINVHKKTLKHLFGSLNPRNVRYQWSD